MVAVQRVPGLVGLHWDGATLRHGLTGDDVHNDLAGVLAAELPALTAERFERLFTGVVVSIHPDPVQAWARFYRNTLERLTAPDPGTGSIGEFAPIYRRARGLIKGGTVLDVASCFGFLPLLLAADGYRVVASDVNAGSMALLAAVIAGRDGAPAVLTCSAEALPVPDRGVDTVLLLHLLEHAPADAGARMLAEAQRVAARRVVVAVPYEDEPAAAYGHVRVLDRAELDRLGSDSGWGCDVADDSGGWLVLDRVLR